jgi:hypothetical protein
MHYSTFLTLSGRQKMLQNVNNPIAMKYGALFDERESVIDHTNKALAPLLLWNFSSIKNISIKDIQILACELKPITNFIRDLDNPIHAVPYYLWSITINLFIRKLNQPIKLDVWFVIFFDKITNFQLNDTWPIHINDLNIDFLVDDKNYIRENKYTIEITWAPSLTVWDFLSIVKPNIYHELELSLKEKINTTAHLRRDIIKKYKDFQLFMENMFEQDKVVDEIITKMYESSLLSLATKKNKTYLDSDIFYYDIGERYRANIIHNSPYNKYFLDELKLYDKWQSLNNPQEWIMKYVWNIIMDIWCWTWEKAEGLVQKILHDDKSQWNEYCYIWFDTNAWAIYDSNYNIYREALTMSEQDDGTRIKNKMEDDSKPTNHIRYLFSEGMTNDLLDGSIKFCCLDNSKPNLSILQKSPFREIATNEWDPAIDIFDHYKDIFVRDYNVENEKKWLLKEMDDLWRNWPSKDQPEEFKETFNKMKHLYHTRQQKREVIVNTEAFKKEKKDYHGTMRNIW